MPHQIRATLRAVSAACLVGPVLIILSTAAARAADDCIAAPNSQPPQGQHWWYRTDRVTQRKCWFLGPRDVTALKAALQARADASPRRPAAESAGPASSSPSAPAAPGRSEDPDARPIAHATESGIPFLVHWSDLLQAAGIVAREDPAMTAWATQTRAIPEPATTGARSREDEDQPPETAAGWPDTADGTTAMLARMLLIVVIALLIAGGLCQAVFSIARTRRRRAYRRRIDWDARLDADPPPPGQAGYERAGSF